MEQRGFTRRGFIGLGIGGTAAAVAARLPALAQDADAGPFRHGVASGDPLADRVILWTRVTTGEPVVEVRWEIARDPGFAAVVGHGVVEATAATDHTVHVDADGLAPGADHWYRFHALGATSPRGRTRTTPEPGAALDAVRLGMVSCAEWEFGYFSAYRRLAARDDVDAVLHLGDYIYEFGLGYGVLESPGVSLGRVHDPDHEVLTLADYRTRYGQYRLDQDLQRLHGAHPMIVVWDDHEFANNAHRDGAENHGPGEGVYAERAAAARQAWREWLPVRQQEPADADRIYRSFRFGDLVDLFVLDGRQYRDPPVANALVGYGTLDPAVDDPARTMLGAAQERWLHEHLRASTATWKVLGNPVVLFPFVLGVTLPDAVLDVIEPILDGTLPVPVPLTIDDWNGYRAEQRELIDVMDEVGGVVVLTGDYHESFATDIPVRPGDYGTDGNSAGVEFVGPAVTSPGLAETLGTDVVDDMFKANLALADPWVKFHEGGANGFLVVEFTAERTQADYVFIGNKRRRDTPATVGASWQSARGTNAVTPAAGPLAARARASGAGAPVVAPPAPTGGGSALPPTGGSGALTAAGALAAVAAVAWASAQAAAER